MADFFTQNKLKSEFFTSKKQGTFQCVLTPINVDPFAPNTLESLDNIFFPSNQVARSYPAK